jgi:hypothetical protein
MTPTDPPRLLLENIGPLKKADLTFGDLTVFVGPQATGKSLALSFLKLAIDHAQIADRLRRYGFNWQDDAHTFLDLYLGRGISSVWTDKSKLAWCESTIDLPPKSGSLTYTHEECTLIPALRSFAFSNSRWPRPFSDFSTDIAYTVRAFSEELRLIYDSHNFSRFTALPNIDSTVLRHLQIRRPLTSIHQEIILSHEPTNTSLPFPSWSAGQREAIPLLQVLSLHAGTTLAIEEPELGLHPQAISTVIFAILTQLAAGQRVVLTTHSIQVLDIVWALKTFRKTAADPRTLLEIFQIPPNESSLNLAQAILKKSTRVYFFDDRTAEAIDISDLNLEDESPNAPTWGRLMEFSNRIGDAVAREVARTFK